MRCGNCKVCCYVTRVPELNKPENQWCKLCSAQGCRVYNHRPESCKNFSCFWYSHLELSDNVRPDLSYVMIEVLSGVSTMVAYVDPGHPGAWRNNEITFVFKELLRTGHPVLISVGKKEKHILLPIGKTPKDALDDLSTFILNLKNYKEPIVFQ